MVRQVLTSVIIGKPSTIFRTTRRGVACGGFQAVFSCPTLLDMISFVVFFEDSDRSSIRRVPRARRHRCGLETRLTSHLPWHGVDGLFNLPPSEYRDDDDIYGVFPSCWVVSSHHDESHSSNSSIKTMLPRTRGKTFIFE